MFLKDVPLTMRWVVVMFITKSILLFGLWTIYLWPSIRTRHCLITVSSKKYVLQWILVRSIFFILRVVCVLKMKSESIRWFVQASGSKTINLWLVSTNSFLSEILRPGKKEVLEQLDSWVFLTVIKLGPSDRTTKQLCFNFGDLSSSWA